MFQIKGDLQPVYTVCGDEPFLVEEAAQQVRDAARTAGHDEREVLHVDRGFDWGTLAAAASNLSLFGSRRLLELRMPGAKPGDAGSRALVAYCSDPAPDTVLLVIIGKLDSSSRNAKWMKALGAAGPLVQCRQVAPERLGAWIVERMRRQGLKPHPDAVQLLVQRVEGNLLAAAQEIDKLALLHEGGEISLDAAKEAVADSARYDVFRWVDTVVSGDGARGLRMLRGLQEEGSEPTLLLWALARELRTLGSLTMAITRGESVDQALYAARVWQSRKELVRDAALRMRPARMARLVRRAAHADRVIKGMAPGSAWSELAYLTVAMAGRSRSAA
jgi:DNA polymerase III subunit delta